MEYFDFTGGMPARYKLTYPEIDAIYKRISKLKVSLEATLKRRERAEVLIGACILEGINMRGDIVKVVSVAGVTKPFIKRLLDERTGLVPGACLWRLDERGRYHLLDDE